MSKPARRIGRSNKALVHAYVSNMVKPYRSAKRIGRAQSIVADDIFDAINGILSDMGDDLEDAFNAVADETMELADDLYEQTPWDESGPTSPRANPRHAADVWGVDFYPSANGFTLAIANPQDYLQFLEAGWSPQADAGWIAAAFTRYKVRLEGRLRE